MILKVLSYLFKVYHSISLVCCLNPFLIDTVPPVVVSLASGKQVVGKEGQSAVLMFRVDNAAPPVELEGLRWIYSTGASPEDGMEITGLENRTTLSMLSFSKFPDQRYINLTVSNLQQGRFEGEDETDEGRYFLEATNPAGVHYDYIDVIIEGNLFCKQYIY